MTIKHAAMESLYGLSITLFFLSGCGATPKPPVAPEGVAPSAAPAPVPGTPAPAPAPPAPAAPDPADAAAPRANATGHAPVSDDADLLARRAEQHARAIEELLNPRGGEPPAPRPEPQPAPVPDIEPRPPAVAVRPAAEPVRPTVLPIEPAVGEPPVPAVVPANMPPGESAAVPASPAPALLSSPAGETLEQALARRAREYPRDLASQLDHQLTRFLKDDPVPDAADLAQLSGEDRDVLTTLLDGLVNFRTGVRNDSNMLIGKKIRPLIDMADRLRSRADLALPTAAICTDIRSFGVYTPVERPRFKAGVATKIAIYCEVENFSSQLAANGRWESKMTQELTLYAENGFEAVKPKPVLFADTCRVRRRDFFLGRPMDLPPTLPIGPYTLKITVIDQQTNRVAETSLPIEIVVE